MLKAGQAYSIADIVGSIISILFLTCSYYCMYPAWFRWQQNSQTVQDQLVFSWCSKKGSMYHHTYMHTQHKWEEKCAWIPSIHPVQCIAYTHKQKSWKVLSNAYINSHTHKWKKAVWGSYQMLATNHMCAHKTDLEKWLGSVCASIICLCGHM